MITKDSYTYSIKILRQEKTIRDHRHGGAVVAGWRVSGVAGVSFSADVAWEKPGLGPVRSSGLSPAADGG